MITSTSYSHSDLNGIQTLMPLTVRVKGAKRIRERLSATWEEAVRNTSLPGSHFFYRVKDFPETNKTLCMDKLEIWNQFIIEWCFLMLFLVNYLLKCVSWHQSCLSFKFCVCVCVRVFSGHQHLPAVIPHVFYKSL